MELIDKEALIRTINATRNSYKENTCEDFYTANGMDIATDIMMQFPTQQPIDDDLIRLGGTVHGKYAVKKMTLRLFAELMDTAKYDNAMLVKILDLWLKEYYFLEDE